MQAVRDGRGVSDLALRVPEELVEAVAQRAAEIVLEQLAAPDQSSPWLTVPEAAEYLRASRQRIYDLLSSRRLTRHRDGTRVLIRRDELDRYLASGV